MAKIKRKSEFAGKGALIQLVGLIVCFVFPPLSIAAGLIIIIIGGAMAYKHICSNCGNRLESTATICPTCKEALTG